METNKVKVSNTPGASIRTIDESNNQGKKLINKLNHDCLAKVLMHLPILERLEMEKVCQKWGEAVDLSWYNIKKIDFNDLMIQLDEKEETLERIMNKCCRFLRHLTITADDQYPWMSYLLKENCQNINHFSINIKIKNPFECKISKEDLVEIINSMKKLKYLKVEMSGLFVPRNFSRKIVEKLPKDIHEIHLFVQDLEDGGFRQIALILERFNSLHCLTLAGFSLTNETLEGILENKNTLLKLDLSYCAFPSDASPIFKNLINLEHLNLYSVEKFNVDEIVKIAHNCSRLTHFEFTNYIDIFDGEVSVIPHNIYRELRYLNLVHLTICHVEANDDGNVLSGMTENWKELKHLDINKSYGLSKADIDKITKLKHLEFVNLHSASEDSEDSENSELFIRIANNCPELKELPISVDKISEAAIFEVSNLKKLEKLHFFNNDNLSGYFFEKIAINCGNLVELSIYSCFNIEEISLIKVGKLENLKILDLEKIENVPNAMFDNFKKLESLSCHKCPSITDEGIIKVLDNCQKLNYLYLVGTGITVESLVYASKRKFVFKLLEIWVDSHVKYEYKKINCTPSPYLIIICSL